MQSTAVFGLLFAIATILPAEHPDFYTRADGIEEAERERLALLVQDGMPLVARGLGAVWRSPFELVLVPDREAFIRALPPEWGLGETACWMVAVGVSDRLVALAPSAWPRHACEHDPTDEAHVAKLLRHELVHVLHGQHHPVGDFSGSEEMAWFIEGLAVMASGQLEGTDHRQRARNTLADGGPTSLAEVWSGPARYGLAGTLVESLAAERGPSVLTQLLPMQTTGAALDLLQAEEEQILASWRRSVLTGGGQVEASRP